VVFDGPLGRAGDEHQARGAGGQRLFHRVLDERLVDHRQHLLRTCLGRGKETCSPSGHRKYRRTDLLEVRRPSHRSHRAAATSLTITPGPNAAIVQDYGLRADAPDCGAPCRTGPTTGFAAGLAAFAAATVAALPSVRISSRFLLMAAGPMPLTRASSSADLNGPCF